MRVQPVNPNTQWANEHTLYLAASGGGKSQVCNQNKAIPASARVILWDPTDDHKGHHFNNKAKFVRALIKGIQSGKGFRIAFNGTATVENFEWWCEVVWGVLDGNVRTYAIAEELSQVCISAGKATPNAAVLLNQGRKYGLVFHGTSQKPQEISKTYYDQCEYKYVGRQKGLAMRKKMALEIGVTPDQIGALQPLQFYFDDGSADEPKLINVKYKKVTGVKLVA